MAEEIEDLPVSVRDLEETPVEADLLEVEEKPAAAAPVEKQPTTEEIGSFMQAADHAEKTAKDDPKPASELDRMGWQTRAIQEFRDLTDAGSTMHRVALQYIAQLSREGYAGADLHYKAATMAHADPRVAYERNTEKARESRISESSKMERPSPSREVKEPQMTPRQMEHAKAAGVTDPEALAVIRAELLKASKELRG